MVVESVGGIFEMDNSDWSSRIRYHIFDTRPDTELPASRFAPESTLKLPYPNASRTLFRPCC